MLVRLSKKKAHQIYKLANGTVVPGASTISKIGESQDFLTAWAHKRGLAGEDYRKITDEAAGIGSVAHFLVTCHFKGDSADLSDFSQVEIQGGSALFDRFKDMWAEQGLDFIVNELELVSETYRYGGTLDIIGRNQNSELVLVDVKSSPRLYGHFYRQIAGYENLWNENNEEKISKRVIFRLDKKDARDDEVRPLPKDMTKHFNVFQKQLDLYYAFKALNNE